MRHRLKKLFLSKGQERGSLVLELSVLMVLLGLFSVSFLLSVNPSSAAVQTALLKVTHELRYAQNRAMVTALPHGFRTLSPTRYEIYEQSPGNPTLNPSTQGPMQVDLSGDFKGVTFSGTYQIEFDSLGRPTIGAGTLYSLKNESTERSFGVTTNTGMLVLP